MKSRLKSLVIVGGITIAVLCGLLFIVQLATGDAVKSRLEALISERTGLAATINGSVSWRYFWPTAVTIYDISARNSDGSEYWIADSLRLEAATLSLLAAPRAPEQWQVQAFQLQALRGGRGAVQGADGGDQYSIAEFWIRNIRPDQPSPFAATLRYQSDGGEPLDLELSGKLHFIAEQRKLEFSPAQVSGSVASGRCEANIALRPLNEAAAESLDAITRPEAQVMEIGLWRRSDWDLDCQLATVAINGETFTDVSLTSNNLLGTSASQIQLPVFFTGSAKLMLSIDASASADVAGGEPPRWVVTPTISNVASGPFLSWLQRSDGVGTDTAPAWQGPVSINGRIETSGNTRPDMVANAIGELTLVSNNGTMDLAQLKRDIEAPLKELGPLVGDAQEIRDWPDTLEYLTLTGRWVPNGARQQITGRLDNLSLDAQAQLNISLTDPAEDTLIATGAFTFDSNQPPMSLPVPPMLADLPLPVTCDGAPTRPRCALDAQASRQILIDVMKGDGPSGLSEKLDEIIDENVPEEYRRAARSLLEILGHSIDDSEAKELEDFLGEDLDELLEEGPSQTPVPGTEQ